jgi:hypothetical protein
VIGTSWVSLAAFGADSVGFSVSERVAAVTGAERSASGEWEREREPDHTGDEEVM